MARSKSKESSAAMGAGRLVIGGFAGYFLIFCIVVTAIFLYMIFKPFITTLIFAAILATAFFPLYKKVLKTFKGREKVASLTTCFLVLILIIVPLLVFVVLLGQQAKQTFLFVQDNLQTGILHDVVKWEEGGHLYDGLRSVRDEFGDVVDFDSIDIQGSILSFANDVRGFLVEQSANILTGAVRLLISFFILVFAMYYLFKDNKKIVDRIMTLSPLPFKHEEELFKKFKEISLATLYGIFLTAILQGILGGIGFFIAGVPNALFWGTAVAIFSLVPVVGTSLIWFPASVFLFLSGNIVGGAFLFFWGLLLVSTVDNFLRAYLIGERTKMNQLLMFLAVFGGIFAFNLIGIIFGPLILTFFFAFLHIYESEYDKVLHKR